MLFVLNLTLQFLINPIAAAGFLKFQNINIFLALLLIWGVTFLLMFFTYFGIGTLVKKLIAHTLLLITRRVSTHIRPDSPTKGKKVKAILNPLKMLWRVMRSIFGKWSLKGWLLKRSVWVLYILLLIPVPYLASVIIVVVKVREDMSGRTRVLFLISGNILKGILVVFSIYYFPILLTWYN